MLDNQYAVLFIRGERPVMDFKFDILKHPSVALTADGKADAYKHGEVTSAVATIAIENYESLYGIDDDYSETTYELLSDEDFEATNKK